MLRTYKKSNGTFSRWESSYFGGPVSLLYNFPQVKLPDELKFELANDAALKTHSLSKYLYEKLVKIFLYEVANQHCSHLLHYSENPDPITNRHYLEPFAFKNLVYKLSQPSSVWSELKPLFKHYKGLLDLTNIWIEQEKGSSALKNIEDTFKKIVKKEKKYSNFNPLSDYDKDITNIKYVNLDNGAPAKLTNEEKVYSEKLLNALDITFDPTYGKLQGLRNGKITRNKIASVPAGNLNVYNQMVENVDTRPFSVCILCDESGSMSGSRIDCQRSLVKVLHDTFSKILPPHKIQIYGHSGSRSPEIYIYQDQFTGDHFLKKINNMRAKYQNYDGPVINSVYERVRASSDENILFIVLSDGQPSGYGYGGDKAVTEMKKIIERCKRDNFVTVGINIQYSGYDIYDYNVVIRNLRDLSTKASAIINRAIRAEFKFED